MVKKIRTKLMYIFLVIFLGTWLYSLTEPLYTPTALPVDANHYYFPEIISHKGVVSGDFPGNSMSAIKESLSTTIDGIEVDVRMSKDGVLFLYHGESLEEYTEHKGIPENFNWSYLENIRYKNSEEKLVSLDELFTIVGSQKTIFIDLKSNNAIDNKIAHKIVDCIKKYNLQESVFVESFNPITLAIIRLYSRDIMVMYDFTDNTIAIGEEVQEQFNKIPRLLTNHWIQKQVRRIIRPDVIGSRFNFNPNILQKLISNGYPIIAWTVDDPNTAKSLYRSGVKGIQSNKPLLIESVIEHNNKKMIDAGGTIAVVNSIINVTNTSDIQNSIQKAKQDKLVINIGGRRHSMGGQTLSDHGIYLNMLNFNNVKYNEETKTVVLQSGATWKKVQEVLAKYGRSVKVMQSDNIFSVGGSISVNVHGWQVGSPPLGATILKMNVITADGELKEVSPTVNSELYKAVIGGYGMFGVIVDAELETVPNYLVEFHALFTNIEKLNDEFEKNIRKNSNAELAYARLSMDEDNLLNEVGLFWYETKKSTPQIEDIKPEKLIALKRSLFRLSEYHNLGKKLRWHSERVYAESLAKNHTILNRNDAMNTDIHILWPLYGNNKDILHEYFVPKENLANFVKKLKDKILKHNINILNVTIREVKKDDISLLPYAKNDMYGLVCLFSQNQTIDDENKMNNFTKDVIDDAITLDGTFYLPYRLHYNGNQIRKAYPSIKQWLTIKNKYDPDHIFNSKFFYYIQNILKES